MRNGRTRNRVNRVPHSGWFCPGGVFGWPGAPRSLFGVWVFLIWRGTPPLSPCFWAIKRETTADLLPARRLQPTILQHRLDARLLPAPGFIQLFKVLSVSARQHHLAEA